MEHESLGSMRTIALPSKPTAQAAQAQTKQTTSRKVQEVAMEVDVMAPQKVQKKKMSLAPAAAGASFPEKCYGCGWYGHRRRDCPDEKKGARVTAIVEPEEGFSDDKPGPLAAISGPKDARQTCGAPASELSLCWDAQEVNWDQRLLEDRTPEYWAGFS